MLGPRVGAPLAGVGDGARPENADDKLAQAGHVSGERELVKGDLGPRRLARAHALSRYLLGVTRDAKLRHKLAEATLDEGIVRQTGVPDQLHQPIR